MWGAESPCIITLQLIGIFVCNGMFYQYTIYIYVISVYIYIPIVYSHNNIV